jgi:hypothetical protein
VKYPSVLSELDTLQAVLAGQSIARYGDGEFALAENRSIRPQRCRPDLARRLREILHGDSGRCLVGIPNLLAPLPPKKAHFWRKYQRCAALLHSDVPYVSSFITRPDNAPWLDVPAYWAGLESLWSGRDVTLVRGDDPNGTGAVSLLASDLTSARSVTEIIAPGVNAWSAYEDILERVGTPDRALLCLGATATVLAVDLARRGVHAIDLGHVGMFLRQHRAGVPIQRVKASA